MAAKTRYAASMIDVILMRAMLIAFIGAIVAQFRRPRDVVREDESPRREVPFEE